MPEISDARDSGLVRTAARGALWTVLTSSTARVVGLTGTLLLTRFLGPEEYGDGSFDPVFVMAVRT